MSILSVMGIAASPPIPNNESLIPAPMCGALAVSCWAWQMPVAMVIPTIKRRNFLNMNAPEANSIHCDGWKFALQVTFVLREVVRMGLAHIGMRLNWNRIRVRLLELFAELG